MTLTADVSIEAECHTAVEKTVTHFGRIDGLVNNAGIGMSSIRPDAETRLPGIGELSAELWDRFYAINMRGPMLLTRAALPHMKKQGWGRIVNNTTSYKTMLRALPYGALKAALESASAVWAAELEGSGVTVNVLVPGGPTDTPFISDGAGWDARHHAAAVDHGGADPLADVGGVERRERPALHRRRLGHLVAAG